MSSAALPSTVALPRDVAIPLARRPDIEVIFGRNHHIRLRDPLTLRHFEMTETEFCLWNLLDGVRGFRSIREEFERRQAPLRLSRDQFDRFVALQHAQGLVISTGPGQAQALGRRQAESRRKAAWSRWLNPLAIRVAGLDPQPLLDASRDLWQLLFNRTVFGFTLAFIGGTLLFAAARANEIASRLPGLAELARPEFVVGVLILTALIKVLHELAHLCVCRTLGGECHDAGLLLLVGLPCLYCDVTDAWRFPRRRDRIAVSLAGVWIELVLASAAFWVWWRAVPGPASLAALQVMVVCSISTLAFNLNPLLKYDGYYALSDLINVPNLGERSMAALTALPRQLLGTAPVDATRSSRSILNSNAVDNWSTTLSLALFGLASLAYRTMLTAVILLTVYRISREWQVEVLGLAVVALIGSGLLAKLGMQGRSWWKSARRSPYGRIESIAALFCAMLLLALLLYPFPRYVSGSARLEPADAERLYVTAPGRLIQTTPEGSDVEPHEMIARLENPELTWALAQLEGELQLARKTAENLERRQSDDPTASRDLPTARERVRSLEQQVAVRTADISRLQIVATQAGRLWAGDYRPETPAADDELGDWTGTALSTDAIGAWLETGTVIGWVATGDEWDALADLPQSDVELIAEGAPARILIDTGGGEIVTGRVESIARLTRERTDPSSNQTTGNTRANVSATPLLPGEPAPFEVRIRLDHPPKTPVKLRSSALLRIAAGHASPLARAWRELLRVLRFDT